MIPLDTEVFYNYRLSH